LELVALAANAGASAIAITDHDTVRGLAEGRAAARARGIEFVPGIEISADYQPGTMHILGYCLNDESPALHSALESLRQARENRNPEIAGKLRGLGIPVDYEEVAALAAGEVVGRPHFARLLVEKGYAASIQDAFDRFLAKGAAAYVEKKRLAPRDAIAMIHGAGGVAVLAHPYQLKLSMTETDTVVGELTLMGLDGIEAIYSRHTDEQRKDYSDMAARHGLLVTGGSDFHGSYKPDISVVRGLGELRVPYELLAEVKSRAGRIGRNSRPAFVE
jgi:predicted metal-dependent phosphoesterase TrpH